MKTKLYPLIALLVVALCSCGERSGYLDEGQHSTISLLTDVEWLMVYADSGFGPDVTYEDETIIYKFEPSGKGWLATGSLIDATIKDNVSYYQWTFTTENFAVLWMSGAVAEGYWLIEKLTSTELHVQWTVKDPVIYPNQDKTYYKFKARRTK
ncbi:MAG: hypothetical protein HFJ95_00065 [Muribaculaceae bacterium]|nr:hypothetical protein [Muribaculaceae bacterium]